jgi:hypothetical protein
MGLCLSVFLSVCVCVCVRLCLCLWAGIAHHYSDSIRTGRSGDRILVGARFSAPVQNGPGAHLASYTMGTGSFPGVKRPGRGVDHPTPQGLKFKNFTRIFCHTVFMCFVFILEHMATFAPHNTNWLVFISEMKSVYSAVRTGSLTEAVCASYLEGWQSH